MQSYQMGEWMPQSSLFTLADKRVYCVLYKNMWKNSSECKRANALSTWVRMRGKYEYYVCTRMRLPN